jgi:hypothetical protein
MLTRNIQEIQQVTNYASRDFEDDSFPGLGGPGVASMSICRLLGRNTRGDLDAYKEAQDDAGK